MKSQSNTIWIHYCCNCYLTHLCSAESNIIVILLELDSTVHASTVLTNQYVSLHHTRYIPVIIIINCNKSNIPFIPKHNKHLFVVRPMQSVYYYHYELPELWCKCYHNVTRQYYRLLFQLKDKMIWSVVLTCSS
jgi:hypothetical protein